MSETTTRTLTLVNVRGLHARASAKFCDVAGRYDANILVTHDDQTAGGRSLMALLMLGAGVGSQITVEATGPEAEAAVTAIEQLVADRFNEES